MAAVAEPMAADPAKHRQELIERLDSLRKNGSFCDVTVTAKGQEFKSHKAVLAAASPFFLSLLESDMRESNEQLIRIELEEATASVMEDVLKYIYTGNVSVTKERGHNLIATADYLLLPGLKTAACGFLKENVTTENCVFNYYFADKYQCVELKEKCSKEINSNFSVIMETEDFLNLDMKQVMEWVSSDDVTVSAEEEVFKGIVKWVSYNKNERESYFPELLHQIRLMSISHNFLFSKLVNEELITNSNECLNFVLAAIKGVFIPPEKGCIMRPPRKCLETHTDVIFVCGGRKALCYLPQKYKWYQLADMMLEHQKHVVTQCRDKVYIFDEQRIGLGNTEVAECYLSSTNSWAAIQTQSMEGGKFSSLSVLNGDVYATGTYSGNIFKYNPDKNDWQNILEAPCRDRWGTCSVSDGRHLYKIGGTCHVSSHLGCATVERFDPSGDSWEEVAAMNKKRHNAFGAAMNGKIYVAGGFQKKDESFTVLNTCEVYNPLTNEWQLMPSLNGPRHSASMVCFEGALYVVGGLKDNKDSRELSVEMFDSEKTKWRKKSTIPVYNCENLEERKKKYYFKACFVTVHKDVLKKVKGIDN